MRRLVLVLGLWLAPLAASAQLPPAPVDPSAADVAAGREAFVAGVERARAEDWEAALEAFTRSYRRSGSPVALFNLASTLRSLGRMRDARDAFDRLLEDPSLDVETQRAAERMRAEAAALVARIAVGGVPPGEAWVTVDREPTRAITARPIELFVDPGLHTLEVFVEARPPWRWRGTLGEGQRLELDAVFEAEDVPEAPAESGFDAAPWVALGAGIAVVLAAVVIGVVVDAEAQLDPRTPYVIALP